MKDFVLAHKRGLQMFSIWLVAVIFGAIGKHYGSSVMGILDDGINYFCAIAFVFLVYHSGRDDERADNAKKTSP